MIAQQLLYFSSLLKVQFPKFCENLERVLTENKVAYSFLNHTKDIWCRDYMPVQVSQNKLVLFRYYPSYLKGAPQLRTDNKQVCNNLKLDYTFSKIVLDGGNVVQSENKTILTDRIFSENNVKNGDINLLNRLEKLLESELIIIPTENEDIIGHADGMVRFLDNKTVIVNDYRKSPSSISFQNKLYKKLINNNLEVVFSPYFPDEKWKQKSSYDIPPATGVYINYLHVNNTILLPQFLNDEQNKQAVKEYSKHFKTILKIDCRDLASQGGLLNCISWIKNKQG